MVRIGIVGIGFMGRIHYLAGQRLKDAKVTAIASRDAKKRAGDWSTTRGNFGPEPGQVDLSNVKTYETLEQLIADPEIDLIDICSPTVHHTEAAIAALEAGKHVLVEKAIALTTAEADHMLSAARKAGKLLMVAHVLPFFPEFRFAAEAIRENRYGKLLAAHFTRVISKPDWSSEIADAAATGGPAIDLHIHDTHFIGLIHGVPRLVMSVGLVERDGSVPYLTTQYLYGPGSPAVTCSSGAIAQKARGFVHGFEIYLEQATLSYSSAGPALTILHADGSAETPALAGGGDPLTAFAEELQTAVEGVRTGQMPDLLNGQLARDALAVCFAECESVKAGRPVPVT